ncbi:MAG: protein kinase [Cyanobacteria bacterium HKST-UBA02]|nr:protein kinase [Cyanobacteria bacterium HKST-UBA02]
MTSWVFSDSSCICTSKTADILKSLSNNRPRLPQGKAPDLGSRYEVLDLIGRGGMGDIYKVKELESNKILAAKVLQAEYLDDSNAIKRFKREAMLASRLQHRNVVNVHGYSQTDDNQLFLVMDFVDGVSLEQIIGSCERIRWADAMSMIFQLCRALAYAHASGIIHRDLKPSNVMLSTDSNGFEQVRLLDLGISKAISSSDIQDDKKLTQTGEIFGSPLYMSPEQCQGEPVDVRSDIYSLGCVMFEILTGSPPFDAENSVKVILKHINASRADLFTRLETCEVPEKLREIIVGGCLATSPDDRYASIDELLSALYDFSEKPFDRSKTVKKALVGVAASVAFILLAGAGWYYSPQILSHFAQERAGENAASRPTDMKTEPLAGQPEKQSKIEKQSEIEKQSAIEKPAAMKTEPVNEQAEVEATESQAKAIPAPVSKDKPPGDTETTRSAATSAPPVRAAKPRPKPPKSNKPPHKKKPAHTEKAAPAASPAKGTSQQDRWSSFRKHYKGE